jgi:hypothetical protein
MNGVKFFSVNPLECSGVLNILQQGRGRAGRRVGSLRGPLSMLLALGQGDSENTECHGPNPQHSRSLNAGLILIGEVVGTLEEPEDGHDETNDNKDNRQNNGNAGQRQIHFTHLDF